MGRTTTTETIRQDETQRRNPFAPTLPVLQSIIDEAGRLTGSGGTFVDFAPESRQALDLFTAAAAEPSVGQSAAEFGQGLLSGSAPATALGAIEAAARGDGVLANPAFREALEAQRGDITDSVLGRFSAAGRLPSAQSRSGPNDSVVRCLGRELARQELPLVAQQFNRDIENQQAAARSLLGTSVRLSELAPALDQASLFGPELLFRVGGLREARERERALEPLQRLRNSLGLIEPIARLGGETTGTEATAMRRTRQEDPLQTALDLGLAGASLAGRIGLL